MSTETYSKNGRYYQRADKDFKKMYLKDQNLREVKTGIFDTGEIGIVLESKDRDNSKRELD